MAMGWRDQYYRYKDFFLNIVALYKQRKDLQAFLEIILSLSTVIIFIVFALRPTTLTIISLYNQIRDKRNTLTALNKKISDLQTASVIFDQDQDSIPNINAAVFGNAQPDTISKQILGVAAKDNITLLGISIGQTQLVGKNSVSKGTTSVKALPDNAQAMPISISFKGSYSALLTFIKDLESLRIPIETDSLTINSNQAQEGTVIIGIITARIPYVGQ